MIHPQAIVEDGAIIGNDCEIAAFAVIKRGVVLGDRVKVDHHAVIGGLPQAIHFDATVASGVLIGDDVTIREGVTINRSTCAGQNTVIGSHVYLMANSHVGHDCVVHAHTIVANAVLLAGHVNVGYHCFLGGGAACHQFLRIGEGVMLSGLSRFTKDIPPFALAHERNLLSGLNLIGLKRRGFARATIADLKQCFKAVYMAEDANMKRNAAGTRAATPEGQLFLDFFADGQRGFAGLERA
jgi:UDP-N-acetylglucosamine acyltransferase